jgi:hypothetical protein
VRAPRLGALLAAPIFLSACAPSRTVREAAENVVLLKQGTVSGLKELRGTGPFHEHAVSPDVLLAAVERAARRARGKGGAFVSAVTSSRRYREVVAKERGPEDAGDDSYSGEFLSAMVATVHPVPGDPSRSRLEVHATHRGPFHRGEVQWERDLPGWVEEELAEGVSARRGPSATACPPR